MNLRKINLKEAFDTLGGEGDSKTIGELNGQRLRLVKLTRETDWQCNDDKDVCYLTIKGVMDMHFRDRSETLRSADFMVIPRGVEYRAVSRNEASVLLFEPIQSE